MEGADAVYLCIKEINIYCFGRALKISETNFVNTPWVCYTVRLVFANILLALLVWTYICQMEISIDLEGLPVLC